MLKGISWNIDSLNAALTSESNRAVLSRDVLETIKKENADIIAIQETKLPPNGLNAKQEDILKKYFPEYNCELVSSAPPAKKGYAGTMILYKKHLSAKKTIPVLNAPDTLDYEGRLLTLEFDNYYFVNVYTPNSGDGLRRLEERVAWDKLYANYVKDLSLHKPVIACGDFNVAYKEIDISNPNNNRNSAGFTDAERESFKGLLHSGFIDTFRYVNGDVESKYSWWSQIIKTSKANNSGWRIDYFLVSEDIVDKIKSSTMIDSGLRADHAPIMIELTLGTNPILKD